MNIIKENGWLFTHSISELAQRFLTIVTAENASILSFPEVRENYVKYSLCKASPNKEDEFYRYICLKYFSLTVDPKQALLTAYTNATMHLREIDKLIKTIGKEVEKIEASRDPTQIQEQKPVRQYYKKHNEDAKAEILEFIKSEIEDYALEQYYDFAPEWLGFSNTPYNYAFSPSSYEAKLPSQSIWNMVVQRHTTIIGNNPSL